jgi:hypothetical protein
MFALRSAIFALVIATALAIDPVLLGDAGDFAILSKTGISTVPTSVITGDIGVSPIAAAAMTGFSLTGDPAVDGYTSSIQFTGKAYAADYGTPTPVKMTTAILNMETAYTDGMGRITPDYINLLAGDISGLTLEQGLYKWGTGVQMNGDVAITGTSTDVFIFQVSGNFVAAANKKITLSGGALAKNIFWVVAGAVDVGAGTHLEGIFLVKTGVAFKTLSSLNGRILSQTAVTLDSATITP